MIDALAKDIERALSAHSRHIATGALKEAWLRAPERLRAAGASGDLTALYTELRDAGRWESRDITAGAALAALNGLLTRIRAARVELKDEPEPTPPLPKRSRHEAP